MDYLTLYRVAESERYILTAERTESGYYVGMMDADTFDELHGQKCSSYGSMIELFEEMVVSYHLEQRRQLEALAKEGLIPESVLA